MRRAAWRGAPGRNIVAGAAIVLITTRDDRIAPARSRGDGQPDLCADGAAGSEPAGRADGGSRSRRSRSPRWRRNPNVRPRCRYPSGTRPRRAPSSGTVRWHSRPLRRVSKEGTGATPSRMRPVAGATATPPRAAPGGRDGAGAPRCARDRGPRHPGREAELRTADGQPEPGRQRNQTGCRARERRSEREAAVERCGGAAARRFRAGCRGARGSEVELCGQVVDGQGRPVAHCVGRAGHDRTDREQQRVRRGSA
jgi:hypothetical protein